MWIIPATQEGRTGGTTARAAPRAMDQYFLIPRRNGIEPKMQDRSWEEQLSEANAASEAKEWQRAAMLWEALRAASPHDSRCWLKAGEASCEAGEFDSA